MSIERIHPRGWPDTVLALTTTRSGGISVPPYDSLNLAAHVGDDPLAVAENRRRLLAALPPDTPIQWLQQVHGTAVVDAGDALRAQALPEADAACCAIPGVACAVMTADCLPVVFTSASGDRVAAAHAGWRGLAAGVLEATVAALGGDPAELLAWVGPCIGPGAFEVGEEVRERFFASGGASAQSCFATTARGALVADLPQLARQRLMAAGVGAVSIDGRCTHENARQFFSYRRQGPCGRMATLITRLRA